MSFSTSTGALKLTGLLALCVLLSIGLWYRSRLARAIVSAGLIAVGIRGIYLIITFIIDFKVTDWVELFVWVGLFGSFSSLLIYVGLALFFSRAAQEYFQRT